MKSPFQLLCDYLQEQMRMSHIYQPVMIKRLLMDGGKAKDEDIALINTELKKSYLNWLYTKSLISLSVGLS